MRPGRAEDHQRRRTETTADVARGDFPRSRGPAVPPLPRLAGLCCDRAGDRCHPGAPDPARPRSSPRSPRSPDRPPPGTAGLGDLSLGLLQFRAGPQVRRGSCRWCNSGTGVHTAVARRPTVSGMDRFARRINQGCAGAGRARRVMPGLHMDSDLPVGGGLASEKASSRVSDRTIVPSMRTPGAEVVRGRWSRSPVGGGL